MLIGSSEGFHAGRFATLRLDRPASVVYASLEESASQHNYAGLASRSSACHQSDDQGPTGAGGRGGGKLTTCSARGARRDGSQVKVELASCVHCQQDFGLGRVSYTNGRASAQPANARTARVVQKGGPSDPAAWARLTGTEVIQKGWYFACQQNQQADLAITGSARDAWQAAIDNMLPVTGSASISFGGSEVRQALGADGSDTQLLILDMGAKPRPMLHFWLCEG
jgi:hypothetical protein